MTKIPTNDWRNLPTEKWNVRTTHQFLIDETKRKFDAEYVPGGKGSKSQRWRTEQGMIKREIDRRGPKVVKRFIEICWDEYYTSDSEKFPYPTWMFMCSYMDDRWTKAEREDRRAEERKDMAERSDSSEIDEEWF